MLLCAALVIISEWGNAAVCIMAATVALVICIAHIPNIRRSLEGNERKLENLAWDKAAKKKQQKQKSNPSASSARFFVIKIYPRFSDFFQKSTENYIEYIDFLWYNRFSEQDGLFKNDLGFDINE